MGLGKGGGRAEEWFFLSVNEHDIFHFLLDLFDHVSTYSIYEYCVFHHENLWFWSFLSKVALRISEKWEKYYFDTVNISFSPYIFGEGLEYLTKT